MIDNQDKLFDQFVAPADDWMRPVLTQPFREGEYVFASDGHAVVRVHLFQLRDPHFYFENKQFKTNYKFQVKSNCREEITVKRMKDAMKLLPRYRKCRECHGKGEVEYSYKAKTLGCTYTIKEMCPACDGYGTITHRHAVKIGDSFFTFRELIRLRFAAEICHERSVIQIYKSPDLNIFEVNNTVQVGMMALRLGDDDAHIRENPVIV